MIIFAYRKIPLMIKITPELSFPLEDVLFSFALESEAADVFDAHHALITGIGMPRMN